MVNLYNLKKEGLDKIRKDIEEEYEIDIRGIKIGERGIIVHTEEGRFLAEEMDEEETFIIYISGLYDYIAPNFKNLPRVKKAKSGKYYIGTSGGLIVLKDYKGVETRPFLYRGREGEFVKLLCSFHKAARGYIPPSGGKGKSDWGKWIEKYKKECRGLKRYVDSIEHEEDSRFHCELLKSCNVYIDRMEEAIKLLKDSSYLSIVEESMRKREICLGNFKLSNFMLCDGDIYIKSLIKCRNDIVERDIADFLQKLLKYCGSKVSALVPGLLKMYHEENPLCRDSIDVIKAFILYPHDYEKVCSRYYKDKNRWSEDAYIERLKEAIIFEDEKMHMVEALKEVELL